MNRLAIIAGVALFAFAITACPTNDDVDCTGGFPPIMENLPPRPYDPPAHIGDAPSLGYIWAGHFPLGNIVAYRHHRRHSDIAEVDPPGAIATTAEQAYNRGHLLRRHFRILTAEDEMKPQFINTGNHPEHFNWTRTDNIIDFAETHGMRVHGHALAWHSQTPQWVFANGDRERRDEAIANLIDHIETVTRYFGDGIESWDVLNEVFQSWFGGAVNANNWRSFLRGNGEGTSGWFSAIGSEPYPGICFIWIAFTTARRVADEIDYEAGRPLGTMILYYNDYNEEAPSKRDAIYFMVREMNQRFAAIPGNEDRLLIDAIGMQAHYHRGEVDGVVTESYRWATSVPDVRIALERFASLIGQGLLRYVSITELDVTVGNTGNPAGNNVNARPPGTPLTPNQARQQAIMYAQLFRIFRDNAQHLRRVSFWGIDDPGSWRHRGSPHLWDGDLMPKEAFWAVADPDAFLLPNGNPRPAAEINAFLQNPRTNGSGFIPASAWD
ncbi:MAG: endo-1,4-beta-xylanase [Treponema sp.]|nr:endo-1,4-beta-xylanase [Treponema sp.]